MEKLLAALVWLAAFLACDASAQIELKFGHSGEPGSLMALSAEEFAKRVNTNLGGRATVVVFASGQLGGDRELLQKLKLGTVELALPGTVMSSESDLFGLFELPYLVKDRTHMRAIEKHIVWPYLAPDAEKKGLKLIAVWENGYRHITNNRRPISVPQDLQGMKLRVPEGKWRVKMFAAYGANPSPMKFAELFTALQTGVMDGQENPFTNIYTAKLHEVQKYLSISGHVYTPAYVTVGARKWATLPSDIRKALEETAKDLQPFIHASAERADAEMLERLRAAGMRVNEVDKSAFVRASRAVYEEFAKEVPGAEELIEKALALASP
jgi:tripartite ATP-independent transporter DctP family solute receptor